MLLLLVENYNQYPAQTEWNISGWGNFWRLLREQMTVCLKNNNSILYLSIPHWHVNVAVARVHKSGEWTTLFCIIFLSFIYCTILYSVQRTRTVAYVFYTVFTSYLLMLRTSKFLHNISVEGTKQTSICLLELEQTMLLVCLFFSCLMFLVFYSWS